MPEAFVRFYGELNDHLSAKARGQSLAVTIDGPTAARDIIERLGVPHVEVELILRNGDPISFADSITHGDRLAVYPAFRSMDLAETSRAGNPLPEAPSFVLDGHLGRLAAYLRLAGYDVWHEVPGDDAELARRSAAEGRVLLTRDKGLLKRGIVEHGYWVRSKDPEKQLDEVAHRYRLGRWARPFTRCLRCNGATESIEAASVAERLPADIVARGGSVLRCSHCGQMFWEGSHQSRLDALVARVLAEK